MTKSGDVLIGRKADGTKVYVEASLAYDTNELWRETTAHERTTERLRLSLTGAIVNWNGSIDVDGCVQAFGQVGDELADVVRFGPGWDAESVARLLEVWRSWHLNDMNAGCDHQSGPGSEPCPETGYRYGSKWLYRPLPYDVFAFVCERFGIEPPSPGSRVTS